jgi:hypothetical protein
VKPCRRLTAVGVTLVIFVLAASPAWANLLSTHFVPPARLVLRVSDLSPGWMQVTAKSTSNAANRHGRMAGYVTEFDRPVRSGLIVISDAVLVYSTVAGAHEQVRTASNNDLSHHYQPLSVGHIGDEALGSETTLTANGRNYTGLTVIFRRGVNVVILLGDGFQNEVLPTALFSVAHVIDSRIRATHW